MGLKLLRLCTLGMLIAFAPVGFADGKDKDKDKEAAVDLNTLLGAEPVAQATDCVYARDVRTIEVLDERGIVLRGTHDRYWINQFKHKCAGLRKNMVLNLSRYGSQICANDRVQAQERGDIGPIASCRLGKFQPVALEQVTTLKAELAGR